MGVVAAEVGHRAGALEDQRCRPMSQRRVLETEYGMRDQEIEGV